ncbi:hypothetical protein [Dinoroseobacter sp. S76]|uniref:hypothetical protein n=1 Tax=Dinoroseobacter sp. S76 TaxID=3415124 RepID=UPI003C7E9C93
MQITLHIGMNKVGSSALQAYCMQNRSALLKRHGILYPETGLGKGTDGRGIHIGITRAFEKDPAKLPQLRASLDAEIAKAKPRHVFISSEFFVRQKDIKAVGAFFEGHEVEVLVYLRRHDYWTSSLYSQAVKTVVTPAWEPGIENFIAHHKKRKRSYFYFLYLLNSWAEVFGRDAMKVRVNERSQVTDVVSDALRLIGAADMLTTHPQKHGAVNASLSHSQVYLIDTLRGLSMDAGLRKKLSNVILSHESPKSKGLLLSQEQAQQIVEDHMPEYAEIARTYLGRADGRLFYDPMPKEEAVS